MSHAQEVLFLLWVRMNRIDLLHLNWNCTSMYILYTVIYYVYCSIYLYILCFYRYKPWYTKSSPVFFVGVTAVQGHDACQMLFLWYEEQAVSFLQSKGLSTSFNNSYDSILDVPWLSWYIPLWTMTIMVYHMISFCRYLSTVFLCAGYNCCGPAEPKRVRKPAPAWFQ